MRGNKPFYTIRETAEMLNIPASTLRYWEAEFPMLKPKRTGGGQRRYTKGDCKLCEHIKKLLHTRGMKIDAAREYLTATYRKCAPRNPYVCDSGKDAINLLRNVSIAVTDNPHATQRIKAVVEWIEKNEPGN